MSRSVISTELVRAITNAPPANVTDFRHPKLPGFVLRARPTGVHTWRVQLANRRWMTLGRVDEVSLADARQAAQEIRARAVLGAALPQRRTTDVMTLRAFLEDRYAPWMLATHPRRTRQVTRVLAAFRELLDERLDQLTTLTIERWRMERVSRRLNAEDRRLGRRRLVAGATMNRDLAALQAAMARAMEWDLITANPVRTVKRLAEDRRGVVRYLSVPEERRLREALAGRDDDKRTGRVSANAWRAARGYDEWEVPEHYTDHVAPLVLLALNTGLRRGELFHLRWRDVSMARRLLTVQGATAKTGQTRYVPLNSEAFAVLQRWAPPLPEPNAFVFPGETVGEPLTNVKRSWGALMTRAQISGFRFHDLRHTFASKLAMASVDLNTVRELLGHSDLKMTLRYAHLAPEHKAAAVERLITAGMSPEIPVASPGDGPFTDRPVLAIGT